MGLCCCIGNDSAAPDQNVCDGTRAMHDAIIGCAALSNSKDGLIMVLIEYANKRDLREVVPSGEYKFDCDYASTTIRLIRKMPGPEFRRMDAMYGGYIGFRREIWSFYERLEKSEQAYIAADGTKWKDTEAYG